MPTHRTFTRSCRNRREFSSAEKVTRTEGLTYEEARAECAEFNANLTEVQKEAGTKLEFTEE